MRPMLAAVVALLLALSVPLTAQQDNSNRRGGGDRAAAAPAAPSDQAHDQQRDGAKDDKAAAKPEADKPPVVTHHEIHVGGKVLRYTATTGLMPLTDDTGKVDAHIFFIAYTLDNAGPKRPLTFSFNGGPGSASVWLHLGAIGPKRIKMQPEGLMPAPPYSVVDNEDTWLDQTDLVFIDPVGTGYSRALNNEVGKKFWGLKGDIESVGDFIRLYLGRYERWSSPLFMVGESYGTTRAAGLSGYLVEHGIAFNGVMLISSVLNFQTLSPAPGNDLPYVLFLPTFTDTAWYHKKLSPDLQADFAKTRAEVEQWAAGPYANALAKGDSLSAEERNDVISHLSRYTGLSKAYVDQSNLRIDEPHFTKELLRDQKLLVGRLDSRFTGINLAGDAATAEFDPSMSAIRPPYTAAFNQYVRTDLGYKSDLEYYILGGGIHGQWDFGANRFGYPDTAEALREAFAKNPFMKLFVGNGYFDLATPYFATQYTLNHMGFDATQHARISLGYYPAGHMMYIRDESLGNLKKDISTFIDKALQ